MNVAPRAPIRSGPFAFAFSDATDGDLRSNFEGLAAFSQRNEAPSQIARVRQVHGAEVVRVETGGDHGEADALFTTERDLSLAVFVADCAAVVVGGKGGVGLAHAGWRGAAAGVVPTLLEEMKRAKIEVEWASLSPMIGSCCFEVGPEVVALFRTLPPTTTTWGTSSVDLARAITDQLPMPVNASPGCTRHDQRFLSFRRGDRDARMVALAWKAP